MISHWNWKSCARWREWLFFWRNTILFVQDKGVLLCLPSKELPRGEHLLNSEEYYLLAPNHGGEVVQYIFLWRDSPCLKVFKSQNRPRPDGPAGHGFGMRLNDRGIRAKMLLESGVWRLGMLGLGQWGEALIIWSVWGEAVAENLKRHQGRHNSHAHLHTFELHKVSLLGASQFKTVYNLRCCHIVYFPHIF